MEQKNFHHPFQPYDIQQQFMQAVYDCIENGKVGIFESPTGTGKSLSLICGSLTWLREHKRRKFDEAMQSIEIDDDEPEWMAEYARESKRKEVLSMRAEFEQRLEKVRAKERTIREKHTSGEPLRKRQRQHALKDEQKNEPEDQFVLDDYHSDDEAVPGKDGRSQYSAETTKLLENLGMILPKQDQRSSEETEEELKVFFLLTNPFPVVSICWRASACKVTCRVAPEEQGPDTASAELTEEVKQITLGSRKNLCINSKVNKLASQTAINERCMELQQSKTPADKKCSYLPTKEDESLVLDFKDHALASIRDIEDLADVGRKLGVCPYYASRPAVPPAEMVTLPYPLLLQKSAREALGICLKGQVVIVDEAHNLMDAVEGICSAQISLEQLRLARESLITYLQKFRNRLKGSNRMYLTQVVRVIDSLIQFAANLEHEKAPGGTVEPGSLLSGKGVDQINLTKLVRYISESKLARKVEGYISHLRATENKSGKDEVAAQLPETPTLTLIQNFLMTLMNPSKEGQFFWSNENGATILRYMLLDPSEHFRDIVESARAVILAGGTMSPMDDYTEQLFPYLPSVTTLSCGHIIPASNLLVRTVSSDDEGSLEFNYKTRQSVSTMQRLGNAILAILPHIQGGTVIFFSSYTYLEQVRKQWNEDGTSARISSVKPTFFDSRAVSVEETFGSYSDSVSANPRGALLFSVIGGKLSEGINFSDDLGRCVMVVGLPFPNLETPEWKAKMQYLDSRAPARGVPSGSASREHAENVCMRAVNQAVGRVIRHKGDWASIILFDSRYARPKVQTKLPGWIKESLPKSNEGKGTQVAEVVEDMSRFFNDSRN